MDIPNLYGSPLPVFVLWFVFIYILGYFIILKNWNKKYKAEASSCVMSLAHGTPALILAIFSIFNNQLHLTLPNSPFQNIVLEYSIAYFLMDLLHYMVLIPSDVLFIAHHVATLYVLITCRYVFEHGAVAILGVLVLAEATTTCQNTWSLARYRRVDSDKAAAVFEFLSPVFYGYYTGVRGFVAPLCAYKIGLVYIDHMDGGNGGIPWWALMSWLLVIVVGIGVSILWVVHLWIDLYRQRSKKDVKKLS